MYNEKLQNPEPCNTATVQPEHLQIAVEMANSLIDRFNAEEQNEALKLIHSIIKDDRQREIHEAEKRTAWLKSTFDKL